MTKVPGSRGLLEPPLSVGITFLVKLNGFVNY